MNHPCFTCVEEHHWYVGVEPLIINRDTDIKLVRVREAAKKDFLSGAATEALPPPTPLKLSGKKNFY